MNVELDYFPHGGDHLDNDDSQAVLTIWLLSMFAMVGVFLIVYGLL